MYWLYFQLEWVAPELRLTKLHLPKQLTQAMDQSTVLRQMLKWIYVINLDATNTATGIPLPGHFHKSMSPQRPGFYLRPGLPVIATDISSSTRAILSFI